MTDAEIIDAVTMKLTGVQTTKDDGNWGHIFFNSNITKETWHSVPEIAVCFNMPQCQGMPKIKAVYICLDGTVLGQLR